MRSVPVLALAGLFALAAAQPQRYGGDDDVVTITSTTDVIKTVDVTKTIYIDGPTGHTGQYTPLPHHPKRPSPIPQHHPKRPAPVPQHQPKRPSPIPHHEHKRPSPIPSHHAKGPAPAPPSYSSAAPVHSYHDHHHMLHHAHSSAPAPAPAPTHSSPAPVYSPAAPSPSPQPATGGEPPASEVMSGDMTHYAPGLGSCGIESTGADNIVALAVPMMNNGANPNANPLCGQTITISYQGAHHTAKIVDTCQGCSMEDIDITLNQFQTVAPDGDGRVSSVKWWFDNKSAYGESG